MIRSPGQEEATKPAGFCTPQAGALPSEKTPLSNADSFGRNAAPLEKPRRFLT